MGQLRGNTLRQHSVRLEPGSYAAGKALRELALELTGATVTVLRRIDTRMSSPPPETMLEEGDVLVMLGTGDQPRPRKYGCCGSEIARDAKAQKARARRAFLEAVEAVVTGSCRAGTGWCPFPRNLLLAPRLRRVDSVPSAKGREPSRAEPIRRPPACRPQSQLCQAGCCCR